MKQAAPVVEQAGKPHGPFDAQIARDLLARLGSDDVFRQLFKQSPQLALRQIGYPVSDGEKLMCLSVERLASAEEIRSAHDALHQFLTSRIAPSNPHCFEAGKVQETLSRR